jgi:shikimate dehydrogenase
VSEHSFLVGLIGEGVAPSLTPPLHEREAAMLGRRLVYRPVDLLRLGLEADAVGRLLTAARELGFDGLNITHPCKQRVIRHLDGMSAQAAALGAVNTVVFEDGKAIGHNTDCSGFARALARGLPDAPRQRVVLVGAGGAGAAVAHALAESQVRRLVVVDRDGGRAARLASGVEAAWGAGRAVAARLADLNRELERADGVVHATPTGMAGHPGAAVPVEHLRAGSWVADIVYRPIRTELLRRAAEQGCATLDGGGMAVYQAADALRLFTGLQPDEPRMLDHFGALLSAENLTQCAE